MRRMSDQFPKTKSQLGQFLNQAKQLPQRKQHASLYRGRLIFAMDATASRQAQWDRACHLQSKMFTACNALGGLDVQLCYFRGYQEFVSSPWLNHSDELLSRMNRVQCLGGYTQIEQVLHHAIDEHRQQSLQLVVIVGDALEENIDTLCNLAGKLGLLNIPLLMIQDGHDEAVRQGFQQLSQLSHGAYARLDNHSADSLADILSAAATFAAGGHEALQQLKSSASKQLLAQLQRP